MFFVSSNNFLRKKSLLFWALAARLYSAVMAVRHCQRKTLTAFITSKFSSISCLSFFLSLKHKSLFLFEEIYFVFPDLLPAFFKIFSAFISVYIRSHSLFHIRINFYSKKSHYAFFFLLFIPPPLPYILSNLFLCLMSLVAFEISKSQHYKDIFNNNNISILFCFLL